MKIETLTKNERAAVEVDFDGLGAKALRIIDALTADRDEWQQVSRDWRYRAECAEKAASKMRDDRDEWKARAEAAERAADMWRRLEAEKVSNLAFAESKRATLRAENERLRVAFEQAERARRGAR